MISYRVVAFRDQETLDLVKTHFIPVSVDSYAVGTASEWEFARCASNNRLTYVTAGGKVVGTSADDVKGSLRQAIAAFHQLPAEERQPKLDLPATEPPGTKPPPPANGLIVMAHYRYLDRDAKGNWGRWVSNRNDIVNCYNPVARDPLWITEAEWKALVPSNPRQGDSVVIPDALRRRLCLFYLRDRLGISMEPVKLRAANLALKVDRVDAAGVRLRLEGTAQVDYTDEELKPYVDKLDHWRVGGGDFNLEGYLYYDAQKKVFTRFDVVALGECWGSATMSNTGRGFERRPLGIALELVSGELGRDRVVPEFSKLHLKDFKYWDPKP